MMKAALYINDNTQLINIGLIGDCHCCIKGSQKLSLPDTNPLTEYIWAIVSIELRLTSSLYLDMYNYERMDNIIINP